MPKNNPPRERRLKPGEYELLKTKTQSSRAWDLWPVIDIAIETAMRRSEILGLEWSHIDWEKSKALLPLTKNGRARWVPLSDLALRHTFVFLIPVAPLAQIFLTLFAFQPQHQGALFW